MHATRSLMLIGSVCALALTFTATPQAHAGIIATDTFTLASPDRDAGDQLVGTQTETGGLTWVGHTGLFFGDDASNGYVTHGSAHNRYGYVPTPTLESVPELVVRAQGRFPNISNTTDAILVGFTTTTIDMVTLDNGVNLFLRHNGAWQVNYRGQATLASGVAPVFHPLGFNTLELTLDPGPTSTTVTARINSVTVLSNTVVPVLNPINYAGIEYAAAPAGSALDNFVLAIPEPGTAAAFATLLVIPALRRRRQRQAA